MKHVLAMLILLAVAAPAVGQAPSESRVAAASALVEAMDAETTMRETVKLTLADQMTSVPGMKEVEDIVRRYVEEALTWSEIRDDVVKVYAEMYTEAELRELRAFYESPIGQRLIETTPELSARMQGLTNRRLQALLPRMQQEIMERVMQGAGGGAGPSGS